MWISCGRLSAWFCQQNHFSVILSIWFSRYSSPGVVLPVWFSLRGSPGVVQSAWFSRRGSVCVVPPVRFFRWFWFCRCCLPCGGGRSASDCARPPLTLAAHAGRSLGAGSAPAAWPAGGRGRGGPALTRQSTGGFPRSAAAVCRAVICRRRIRPAAASSGCTDRPVCTVHRARRSVPPPEAVQRGPPDGNTYRRRAYGGQAAPPQHRNRPDRARQIDRQPGGRAALQSAVSASGLCLSEPPDHRTAAAVTEVRSGRAAECLWRRQGRVG